MSFWQKIFSKTFSRPLALNGADRAWVANRWEQIAQLEKTGSPSALRQAVIEGDKLLEFVLKKLVNENQSLGENLKQAKDLFPSWSLYQQVWEAHKIRNALVHEAGFEPTQGLTRETIAKFRLALQTLGAL